VADLAFGRHSQWFGSFQKWKRVLLQALCGLLGLLTVSGCAQPKGPVFPPLDKPIVWPGGEEQPRISYVGSLSSDRDLKPGQSFFESVGEALFGKKSGYGMIAPYAVCTDGRDRVFVSDTGAHLIHVFNLKTRKYEQWKPEADADLQMLQPVGLVYDSYNRLLVSDSVAGTIFAFDDNGRYLGHFGEDSLRRPCGITFDDNTQRILVVDSAYHQLVELAMDGELIQRVGRRGTGPGEFNFPTHVAIDNSGQIYVSDSLNFRIQVFDSDLKPIHQIGKKGDMPGYFSLPKGLAIDPEGHLYVLDAQFEAVEIFDERGRLLMSFGQEGHGPGEFWLPSDIFIDDNNRIWITDSYNRRVQVFDFLMQVK